MFRSAHIVFLLTICTWLWRCLSWFTATSVASLNNRGLLDDGKSSISASDKRHAPSIDSNTGIVKCPTLLNEIYYGNRLDSNNGLLYARWTSPHPQFWIAVHKQSFDPVRFSMMDWGKYYEKDLSKSFTEILDKSPRSIVLDVGGNIGWFSLLSLSLGHNVYVWEPNPVNLNRMCESLRLNGWDSHDNTSHRKPGGGSITIHARGISNVEGKFWLEQPLHGLSNGASRVVIKPSESNAIPVSVGTLDQVASSMRWLSSSPMENYVSIAILKVDVEGLEAKVFRGASKLLNSGVIQNIFMEGNVGSTKEISKFKSLCRQLFDAGYAVHRLGGSMGPRHGVDTLPNKNQSQPNFIESLTYGCQGYKLKNRRQCNIWWKLQKDMTL
jgi:FkbM family methyltransferase